MQSTPFHEFSNHGIRVVIWRDETPSGEVFYTYEVTRACEPGSEGERRSSASFGLRDMSGLLAAVVAADEWIRTRLREAGQLVADPDRSDSSITAESERKGDAVVLGSDSYAGQNAQGED